MSKNKDRRKENLDKAISYILMTFLFFTGIAIGLLLKVFFPSNPAISYNEIRMGGNEYINPLVDFESVDSTKIGTFVKLEKELEEYIEAKIENPEVSKVSHISLYYKDLNSGGWIGIKENESFSPASLLKLPMMIAAYKIAENDNQILSKEIVFRRTEPVTIQTIIPEDQLKEGKSYTVDELVNRLIKYSDNEAIAPLLELIPYSATVEIYEDLGIKNPYLQENEDQMTVKEYASFFRILYNASYLNKDMSTKALKLLSETNYDNGIVAGIPKDIKIANKFGERGYLEAPKYEGRQLHDCGIVYHSTKPYIFCIMTKGSETTVLQDTVKDLSSIVYSSVNKN